MNRLAQFLSLLLVGSAIESTLAVGSSFGTKQNRFAWSRSMTAESNFQDARDYLNKRNPAQLKDFLQDTQLLLQEFNTHSDSLFKSMGEFENYAATEFLCSVDTRSGQLGTCLLTLVGTHHEVDLKTGTFKLQNSKTYSCNVSIRASVGQLMYSLEKAREEGRLALEEPLPNETFTLKSKIKECLD